MILNNTNQSTAALKLLQTPNWEAMGDFKALALLGLWQIIPRCAPSSVALAAGQPSTATHIAADASFHTHITVKRRAAVCIATIGPGAVHCCGAVQKNDWRCRNSLVVLIKRRRRNGNDFTVICCVYSLSLSLSLFLLRRRQQQHKILLNLLG